MKITGKMFSLMMALLFITSLGFVSCSDDDSPSEHDVFVGKYDGFVSYSNGESNTEDSEGSVEVVKVGNHYNFLFSNGIPDITDVEFENDGETLISVGSTETNFIRVTAHSLNILYTENDNDVWTANCSR